MTPLARELINRYQKGLPLSATPYQDMAQELGVSEADVLATLDSLIKAGMITRTGPVFNHHRAGASTLLALAVPPSKIEEAATWLNEQEGINHNYQREHFFNLWFVATAADAQTLAARIEAIRQRFPDAPMLDLPMEAHYHIDLAFPIDWDHKESRSC